jgi:translation elongation factor EF-Tu-like GTPase
MTQEILNIEDVFQIEGRGTIVIGVRGEAWDSAKPGDPIELRRPDGNFTRTAIKDMEVMRKGVFDGPPFPGAVLLADALASDLLPSGTRILRLLS